jgi:hypothetical protein
VFIVAAVFALVSALQEQWVWFGVILAFLAFDGAIILRLRRQAKASG